MVKVGIRLIHQLMVVCLFLFLISKYKWNSDKIKSPNCKLFCGYESRRISSTKWVSGDITRNEGPLYTWHQIGTSVPLRIFPRLINHLASRWKQLVVAMNSVLFYLFVIVLLLCHICFLFKQKCSLCIDIGLCCTKTSQSIKVVYRCISWTSVDLL